MPLRAAAIDLGTNTIKMAVGETDSSGRFAVIADERLGARLGQGVDAAGRLNSESQQRALDALRKLVGWAHELKVDKLRIAATSAMRDAKNRDEFIDLVRNDLGMTVEVLSEEDEALLSFKAVALDPELGGKASQHLVFDVGGGSTELVVGTRDYIASARSLRIGAVRLTERYLADDPPTGEQLADASAYAEEVIKSAVDDADVDKVVGVGGTIVNAAAMIYAIPLERYAEVHGLRLSQEQVQAMLNLTASLTVSERRKLVGLEHERADVIVGGIVIVERIMHVFGVDEVTVSTRGLRYGLLYDMLGLEL